MSHFEGEIFENILLLKHVSDFYFKVPNKTQGHFTGIENASHLIETFNERKQSDKYFKTPNKTQGHFTGNKANNFIMRRE